MSVSMAVVVAVFIKGGVSVEDGCVGSFPVIGIVRVSVSSFKGGCVVFVRTLSSLNTIKEDDVAVISRDSLSSWEFGNAGVFPSAANPSFAPVSLLV
jgi:hypothetical protein